MLKFPADSLRNSIYVRMVVTYLVVIIPIILLSIYLYNWSYDNASREISRAAESRLTSHLDTFQRETDWMELQMFDLLEGSTINRFVVTWELMDEIQQKDSLNYLLHRLSSVKNSSAYIDDIYVHIGVIGKSVSAMNGIYDLDAEKFQYFSDAPMQDESRFFLLNDALQLAAAKQSGTKGVAPLFIVQVAIDPEQLRGLLRQVNTYPDGGSFLVSETTGFTLSSREDGDPLLGLYMRQEEWLSDRSVWETGTKTYQVNGAYSDALQMTVFTYLPEEEVRRPLSKFTQWAWLYALVSLLAVLIYSYFSYKKIHKPLLVLVQSFRRMEGGVLDIHIDHHQNDEFGYLYDRFNLMIKRLQTLIEEDFKQKMMMQKAELKQLQSQINPHFLYNSFFILHSMAKIGDLERIEEFTLMIGEYFRFITRNGEDYVQLSEEVKHSRMYTEIQKLRFSRRIKVEFDELPGAMERIRVPKLIIQPIIENAYEHSLETTEEGRLRVVFEMKQDEVRIIVENSGSIGDETIESLRYRLDHPAEAYEMTGLMNIHRRLKLTFGEGSGLFLSRSEWQGLKVVMRIMLSERDETENV